MTAEDANTSAEYAVILGGVSVAAVVVLEALGVQILALFESALNAWPT